MHQRIRLEALQDGYGIAGLQLFQRQYLVHMRAMTQHRGRVAAADEGDAQAGNRCFSRPAMGRVSIVADAVRAAQDQVFRCFHRDPGVAVSGTSTERPRGHPGDRAAGLSVQETALQQVALNEFEGGRQVPLHPAGVLSRACSACACRVL